MDSNPSRLTTFLLADPGDSLQLWEQHATALQAALPRFRLALQQAIAANHGELLSVVNDTVQAAFHSAPDALKAALAAQRALLAVDWKFPLRPRLALLTGTVQRQGREYLGQAPHRAVRQLAVGHGGQVLLCQITAQLVADDLPDAVSLLDLGEHRLPDLARSERIFQLVAPGLPEHFSPLKSLDNQQTNLPVQPDTLIGRHSELQTLTRLLRSDEVRLVTLTGFGGIGKTRLALQTAADLLAVFPDGVFFAPLDQISQSNLVASAVVQALSLHLSGSKSVEEALQAYLHTRRALLVLDNFEHVQPAAPLISRLLATCPQLKILVTSREGLHLRGEREFPVSPLPFPALDQPMLSDQLTQFASVALFIQRAQAVRPDFAVDNRSAPAVAEICAFLDGLPLAIELAAVKIRLFSPQALLARLKAHSPLQLLSTGPRDLPARQQTLQKTMEWSYSLLNKEEQALFRRLGVFAGGFTVEAVAEVCRSPGESADGSLELLTSLVEKSLVWRREDDVEQLRFSLLFVLREFALRLLERVGELPAYHQAHIDYYLALAKQAEQEWGTRDQVSWFSILAQEHDNLREALTWAISSRKVETSLELAGLLWQFWTHQGYLREGENWINQILSLPNIQNASARLRADGLRAAGALANARGDYKAVRTYCEQCLEINQALGDNRAIANSLGNLGYCMIQQGESQAGAQLLEQSIALFRKTDDKRGLVVSLVKRAIHAMDEADLPLAQILLEEGLTRARDEGYLMGIAITVSNLGYLELCQGNYDRAKYLLEESYHIHQTLGQKGHVTEALACIGVVLLKQGNLLTARSHFEQALSAYQESGQKRGIAEVLEGLAGVAAKRGNAERAGKIFGAAEALREEIGAPLPPSDRNILMPMIREAQSILGQDAFISAWSLGRRLLADNLDHLITYALEADATPPKPAGLTKREREIIRLLAQGLTDAQIAERLFISPRTVNAHLSSIYSKLDVNSRSGATRFALENGLA